MKLITTRTEILDLLINVEINPKEVLKHNIKDIYISNELNAMLESFLLSDDYTRTDFNNDIQILTKIVNKKYN